MSSRCDRFRNLHLHLCQQIASCRRAVCVRLGGLWLLFAEETMEGQALHLLLRACLFMNFAFVFHPVLDMSFTRHTMVVVRVGEVVDLFAEARR